MSEIATRDDYGVLSEPATLTISRLLPGPAERIWSYLTDGELRRQWLASGPMDQREGAAFTLTWRNDDLGDTPGTRPDGFPEEHSMESRVLACDPPRRLAFSWGEGDVTFDLAPQPGGKVLLTMTHRRVGGRPMQLNIAAGWHAHLDLLAARLQNRPASDFWGAWTRLKGEYDRLLPA